MNDTIQDIRDLEERRRVAMIAVDLTTLDQLFSDVMAYTHSSASVDTKAEYLEKLGNGYFDYRELTFADLQIRLAGDAALVTGRMTGDVMLAGVMKKLHGQMTVVWIKQDGRWQMLSFQSTPFPLA